MTYCIAFDFWLWTERLSFIFSILIGIGAIALTIYISRQETKIKDFNNLLEKTKTIVELLTAQNAETLRIKSLERKANKNSLITTWLAIQEHLYFEHSYRLDEKEPELQIQCIKKVQPLLVSESKNPILLEKDEAIDTWMDVFSRAKIILLMFPMIVNDRTEVDAGAIPGDLKRELSADLEKFWKACEKLDGYIKAHFVRGSDKRIEQNEDN